MEVLYTGKMDIKDQVSVLGSPVIVIFLIGSFWNSSEIGSIWIILEMDQAKNLHCEWSEATFILIKRNLILAHVTLYNAYNLLLFL